MIRVPTIPIPIRIRRPVSGLCLVFLWAWLLPAWTGLLRAGDETSQWTAAEEEVAMFQMADIYQKGKISHPAEAVEQLWELVFEAEQHGALTVWAQGSLDMVRLALLAEENALTRSNSGSSGDDVELLFDKESTLKTVIQRTSAAEDRETRLDAYELLSSVQLGGRQAELAARTLEKAANQALDGQLISRATQEWLSAAKLRRQLGQPAKLQAVWAKLDVLTTAKANSLPASLLERLAAERLAAKSLLDLWPEHSDTAEAQLQPIKMDITTATQAHEDGVGVVHLLHGKLVASAGELSCEISGATITSWSMGADGVAILLGKAAPGSTSETKRPLRLLPLQDVKISVIADATVAAATVSLKWTSENGATKVETQFQFSSVVRQDNANLLGQGTVHQIASVPVPVEHRLYFRGIGQTVENSLIVANRPCRLEIYDQATGVLLAVDAEGDGGLSGPNDFLAPEGDTDANGFLDASLDTQHQVAAWEIYACPAASAPAHSPVQVQFFLAEQGEWQVQGQDEVVMP